MRIDCIAVLEHGEVRDKLHYDLICSSIGSTLWNTSYIKRAYGKEFTWEERDYISHTIKPKAHKWYLDTGVPSEVKMSYEEYQLWRKLGKFCYDYCNINGNNWRGLNG